MLPPGQVIIHILSFVLTIYIAASQSETIAHKTREENEQQSDQSLPWDFGVTFFIWTGEIDQIGQSIRCPCWSISSLSL